MDGIDEDFESYDYQVKGPSLRQSYEQQLTQTGLPVAFAGTSPEVELCDPELRTAAPMNELWRTFNFWSCDGKLQAQRRIIARSGEHDVEDVRKCDCSDRIPIDIRVQRKQALT